MCNTQRRGLPHRHPQTSFMLPREGLDRCQRERGKSKALRSGQTRARRDSSGWARFFEEPRVTGTEPAMGEAWSGGTNRALLPSPRPLPFVRNPAVLCGWGVGGGAGSRGAAPGPPLLIGPWRRQQSGRHAPGPGRADKACQGTHDLQLRNPSGSHHRSSGQERPWSFSTASRRNLLQARAPAELPQRAEELSYPLLLDTDRHAAALYSFEPGELGNN